MNFLGEIFDGGEDFEFGGSWWGLFFLVFGACDVVDHLEGLLEQSASFGEVVGGLFVEFRVVSSVVGQDVRNLCYASDCF